MRRSGKERAQTDDKFTKGGGGSDLQRTSWRAVSAANMTKRIALACTSCLLLAVCTGWGQTPLPKPADTTSAAHDPYYRQTTRKTVVRFLGAAQLARYGTASQYIQFSPSDPLDKRKVLASKFRDLLDHGFSRAGDVSNRPEGSQSDDLPRTAGRLVSSRRPQARSTLC